MAVRPPPARRDPAQAQKAGAEAHTHARPYPQCSRRAAARALRIRRSRARGDETYRRPWASAAGVWRACRAAGDSGSAIRLRAEAAQHLSPASVATPGAGDQAAGGGAGRRGLGTGRDLEAGPSARGGVLGVTGRAPW